MILKVRNRILRILLYLSLFALASSIAVFVYTVLSGNLVSPPDLRIPKFLSKIPFARQNLAATLLSFAFLSIYVPVVFFYIYKFFENTQSSEIIFFTAFLIGILCETARFFTICFVVWRTFTNLLIFLGNIVLFGRIIAPFSFVAASIFSGLDQRQDIERNYLLMTVLAFIFAIIVPLNTAKISSTGLATESAMFLLNGTRFILIVLAALSLAIKSYVNENKDYISQGIWMLVLYIGYTFLISADCFFLMIPGAALLSFGTYFYLKTLHKMYMWI